jgi:peptidoglycan biosynthesis protein MviN/MurJ (putative lipid II flippase)
MTPGGASSQHKAETRANIGVVLRVFGLLAVLVTVLIMVFMWVKVTDSMMGPGCDESGGTTSSLPVELPEGVAKIVNDC